MSKKSEDRLVCKNCVYGVFPINEEENDIGECRLNPPVYSQNVWDVYLDQKTLGEVLNHFPLVREFDWCSKFNEKITDFQEIEETDEE